jgi:hypothetical protein
LELTETMTTAKTTALTSCIDADLQAAFILAKAANVLSGSLLPMARIGVLRELA